MNKNILLLLMCICGLVAPAMVQAQTFTSVDINPGADSSNPVRFTLANGKVFFDANDGVHGYELWVTDGTVGGTQLVSDIWPGTSGSSPNFLTAFNNKLYFAADDSVHGNELWVSDGTV